MKISFKILALYIIFIMTIYDICVILFGEYGNAIKDIVKNAIGQKDESSAGAKDGEKGKEKEGKEKEDKEKASGLKGSGAEAADHGEVDGSDAKPSEKAASTEEGDSSPTEKTHVPLHGGEAAPNDRHKKKPVSAAKQKKNDRPGKGKKHRGRPDSTHLRIPNPKHDHMLFPID